MSAGSGTAEADRHLLAVRAGVTVIDMGWGKKKGNQKYCKY